MCLIRTKGVLVEGKLIRDRLIYCLHGIHINIDIPLLALFTSLNVRHSPVMSFYCILCAKIVVTPLPQPSRDDHQLMPTRTDHVCRYGYLLSSPTSYNPFNRCYPVKYSVGG